MLPAPPAWGGEWESWVLELQVAAAPAVPHPDQSARQSPPRAKPRASLICNRDTPHRGSNCSRFLDECQNALEKSAIGQMHQSSGELLRHTLRAELAQVFQRCVRRT